MGDKFPARDIRETEEGRQLLEGGGSKGDGKKKEDRKKVWGKDCSPDICGVCFGHCCGPNRYRSGMASRATQTPLILPQEVM